jgi:hypothetical protein
MYDISLWGWLVEIERSMAYLFELRQTMSSSNPLRYSRSESSS